MREAAAFISSQSAAASDSLLSVALSAAQDALRSWSRRGHLAKLNDFDDYQLADIGVTREDLRWALTLPLTHDPSRALQRRALKRKACGWRDCEAF